MWTEKELEEIKTMLKNLSGAYKASLGITLELDEKKYSVWVVSESGKKTRSISIEGDNAYGALKDITAQV